MKWKVAVLLCASASLYAQTGQITGRVTDTSDAVIAGSQITITEISTGIKRSAVSNSEGYYTAPSLLPGAYSVAVEQSGFRPVTRTGLELKVNQELRLDFKLEVGTVSEKIMVEASAPVLETETPSMGQVIDSRQVVQLPLLGRNPYALGGLAPGVRIARGMNDLPVDQISTASVSINGARGNQNEFLLDGAPNTGAAQNQPIVYANADSVQEFKVETNSFSAEYGRAAGGVFNVVTKSGTNDIHFSLYEFLRNDALNANDWFANQAGKAKAPLKFNQFGGVLGGPVVIPHFYNGKNKTFFFVSTELVRFIQGVTYAGTLPNPTELAGNFSGTTTSTGQKVTIYDPSTTRPNPNGSGYIRDPFPNNVIPANRIDPVTRKLLAYIPSPNAGGVNNYVRTDGNNVQKNTFSTRLDHNLRENTRIFGRYSYDDSPFIRALPYGPGSVASPGYGAQDFTRYNAVLEGNHVFSPTLIATVRGTFSRLSNFREPPSSGFDISQLGLPAGLQAQIGAPSAFPAFDISGYSVNPSISNNSRTGLLGSTGLIAFGMNNYALQANATKTFGQHTLKFGGEYRVIQFNTLQTNDASTQFNFTSAFTQGPNAAQASATGGSAVASFLLGLPATGSVTPSPALAIQSTYYGAFVQDGWKLTSNLTLNIGLRYEIETPRTERYNQLTNFDYNAASPLSAPGLSLKGALTFVGVNGASRYQSNPDRNNFAPRVGFAWHVTPKTVIRAGGGIFFGTNFGVGGAPSTFGISGFGTSTNLVTSLDGVTPTISLSNPYATGLNTPTGSSLGASTLLGQSISYYDRSNVTPYTVQWNFDIQRELPRGVLFDIGYVATRGLKFQADRIYNQLPDSALALGDALRTQVANPFFGKIAVGTLAAKTVSQAQLLRPYPQYDQVTSAVADWAPSMYHALQVKVEKRFAKGVTVLGSYTYSKLMDVSTGPFSGESLGSAGVQNWNDLRSEYSVSGLDQTHRLVVTGVYELPFFRNQQGFVGRTLGGWELGAVATFYSGSPLGISSSVNGTFSQGGGQRPNWNGQSAKLDNPTPARWFDPSVFSNPAAYTFGTSPRSFSGLRSDNTKNLDLSLHKNTHLTERLVLQLRGEAFNLTNTPIFALPNTTFGAAAFGVVSSQANQPRILQFALKLLF
jgi:outer membrane receptor protein involved in Fe transport